ncbi:MAG: cyclic nucleotide-binding domain-containing protein [Candidatus Wenzhouxiangella sp. M2_3B_020]
MTSEERIHDLISRYFELSGSEVGAVAAAFDRKTLRGGEWLFRQGEPGDALCFLVRGRLQVWIDPDEPAGESRFVGEVMPGETVGEISLLTGQPRSASVRAARDSLLLRLDRESFERLAAAHPTMAVRLAGSIAERLQHRTSGRSTPTRRLVNICLLPLDDRPSLTRLVDRLAEELSRFDTVLVLDPARMGDAGAPVASLDVESGIPDALPAWLDEQEYGFRFVIYRCHDADSPWSRLAVRQADLLIRLADSSTDPAPRSFERIVQGSGGQDPLCKQALVLWHPQENAEITGTAAWLDGRDVDFHLHVRSGSDADLPRVARIVSGRGLGLVLGAGAARGFAHIGVYRALAEAAVDIDWVGGASIGAIFGAAIAKGWSPATAHERARKAFVVGKPFSNYTIPVVSLLSGKRMLRLTGQLLTGNIEDMPLPFFCNSSSLDSGSINIHTRGPIVDALQASAAMPGAFPPAVVDKHLAVDGAVLNGLPIDIMRQCPVGEVVAVDLSSDKTYEVDYRQIPSAWQLLRSRWLPFGRRYRVPGLVTLLLKSTEIGSMVRVQAQRRDADLLLAPDVRKYGLTNVKAFDQVVEAGYRHAVEVLPGWLARRNRCEPAAGPATKSTEIVDRDAVDQKVEDIVDQYHQPG